jgi:formate dehydrogenase alpha subunit
VAGLAAAFGSGAMTNAMAELASSEAILITGSNPSVNHPIVDLYIREAVRDHEAKLVVVDPRRIELTKIAHLWLRPRPGTDVAWINGLMHVIREEGLWDRTYVDERTEGFEALAPIIDRYTPQLVEQITGIPADDLKRAARYYATAQAAAIVYAMGITQHTSGTNNVKCLANLAMLCGNVGIRGGGVNPLRGQNNVQGACDMGALPNCLPGYQGLSDQNVITRFETAWQTALDPRPGLAATEVWPAIFKGKVKGLYVMGENPVVSDPNTNEITSALAKLEFLVVQDIFMTETAKLADVVLPAASFAEKDGTFTNTERRVQRVRKAIDPPGRAWADWRIIAALSRRMGYPMSYNRPEAVMDEIASLTPIYGGIRYDRLNEDGLQWPCPTADHPGTPYLHKGTFTRGLGRFHATEYIPSEELPDDRYPLLLSTGRVREHYNSGTMSRRVAELDSVYPEPLLEIHPTDAQRFGVKKAERVKISSRRGEVAVRAEVTTACPKGVVFLPFHFGEAAANLVTIDRLDDVSKIPEYKVCAVRIDPM